MDSKSSEWEKVEKSSYPMFYSSLKGSTDTKDKMFVGGSLELNGYTYNLMDAQDATFQYMEDHAEQVNITIIFNKCVCCVITIETVILKNDRFSSA